MIYDDSCRGSSTLPGLTHSWLAGGWLYRGLGRLDACRGVRSWEEGLDWLASFRGGRPIAEIQFWGHGKWGCALVDGVPLDARALSRTHHLHDRLVAIRRRLAGPQALWWFRTCETFGAHRGHDFARRWTSFFDCRAAGHTFIIGPWQSGLHSLAPGAEPDWSADEGLADGTPDDPAEALWSGPLEPRTITCLSGSIPEGW
jgi:hypothetical protein